MSGLMELSNTLGAIGSGSGSTAFSGRFDLVADTNPGAPGPLAAPKDCGDRETYLATIRRRYATDRAAAQQIACMARRVRPAQSCAPIAITGPFAADAREILQTLAKRNRGCTKP